MRRLTLALFLLFLMASSALACEEEMKPEWIKEKPAPSWLVPSEGEEGSQWERSLGLWVMIAGSASLGLGAVSIRAGSRTGGRDRKRA